MKVKRMSLKGGALLVSLVILSAAPSTSSPVEVNVSYRAMEKLIVENVFTVQGRKYLYGSPDSPCLNGYLFGPKLSGVDGRIRLRMDFQGSLGEYVAGRCLGISEGFPVDMTGRLTFRRGVLGLEDVRMSGDRKNTEFNQYIDSFIQEELQRFFRYDAAAMIRALIADYGEQTFFDLEVSDFQIPEITVGSDGVRYGIGFVLEVR